MTTPIPPATRVIVFDAVGTLIHPEPPAAVVYAEAGQRFGSRLSTPVIATRFRAAFRRQETIDQTAGFRTSETRETARWRAIVGEVLDDVTDLETCFRYLYEHFARPNAWRIEEDVVSTLFALQAYGYRLGIASNFDRRLRRVLESGDLRDLPLIISAVIGWRKPAAEFFAAICQVLRADPRQVLYVGDDLENDCKGARTAGLSAVLFDPRAEAMDEVSRIARLSDLL